MLLIAGVLSTAALVAIVIAWFAALFTTRVPAGITEFLVQVLQYLARAYGFTGLLSGEYPPFDIDDGGDYAVEAEIDAAERFNRAAVFFRALLQLPAVLITQILWSGTAVLLLPLWFVTLAVGRLPTAAHQAVSSMLQYQLQTFAYVGLVTSTYPRSPFTGGDLPMSRAAKVLVAVSLVLGVAGTSANVALNGGGFGLSTKVFDLDVDYDRDFDAWVEDVRDCTVGGDAACERRVDARFLFETERYVRDLRGLDLPQETLDEAAAVADELDAIAQLLRDLSETSGEREQQRLRFLVDDAKIRYDDAQRDLYDAVVFS